MFAAVAAVFDRDDVVAVRRRQHRDDAADGTLGQELCEGGDAVLVHLSLLCSTARMRSRKQRGNARGQPDGGAK
jgi:hypothetical protein